MVKRAFMLSILGLMAITMGCTTTQKWMAGGAAVGATVGGIWAANGGLLNAGEGAAVGAVTGATVGALIGDQQEIAQEWHALSKHNDELAAKNSELQEDKSKLQTKLQACESDKAAADRKIENLEGQVANLKDELAKCKGSRMVVTLSNDVLFKSGSAVLSAEGRKALDEAAAKIMEAHGDKFVTVEGHTDIDPIKVSGWKDNWELGANRALVVLRYLIKKGVEPAKCSAATYSKYQPVAEGDSKEAKAKNRRSVIVIHTGWPRF